ncbi:MAG: hypothetical protein ACI4T5_06520 [Prevotella sp.]
MKKYLFFVFMLFSTIIVCSCGGNDEDNEQEIIESKSFTFKIGNYINKNKISANKSDGNLYDVNIVCSNGEVYTVGDIMNGKSISYKLPDNHIETDMMVLVAKIGRNSTEADENDYVTPEYSYGIPELFYVFNSKVTSYDFTEKTTYSVMKYSTLEQLKEFAKTLKSSKN